MYQESFPTTSFTAFTLFGCPILSLLLSWQQKHSVFFCRENCFYCCIVRELGVIFKFFPVSKLESRYLHFFHSEFCHSFAKNAKYPSIFKGIRSANVIPVSIVFWIICWVFIAFHLFPKDSKYLFLKSIEKTGKRNNNNWKK